MKKTLFVGLLVVALVIWGAVLWRSRGMFENTDKPAQSRQLTLTPANDSVLPRDPFRGPFTVVSAAQKPTTRPSPTASGHPTRPPPFDSSSLRPKYQGYVAGRPPMVILGLDGKTELVPVGGTGFGWKVQSASPEKAKLKRGPHTLEITP